jgi:CDP-diacylglycerol--glycerol-3-phosphate 3-phosphatidyltransferase
MTQTEGPAAFRRDILLLPNVISLGRIVVITAAAVVFLLGHPVIGVLLGLPAGISDYLDGYLARKRGQATEVGALLDCLGDILFHLVCFGVAATLGVWPLYLLLAWGFRDMGVTVMRASAAQQGFAIRSSYLGKVAVNFTYYSFFMMGLDAGHVFPTGGLATFIHWFPLISVHVGVAMQWISGFQYLRSYIHSYRGMAPGELKSASVAGRKE